MTLTPDARVLVGFSTNRLHQRHVLVPASQFNRPELIARYVLRMQFQLLRIGVKSSDMHYMSLPSTSLQKTSNGYMVKL